MRGIVMHRGRGASCRSDLEIYLYRIRGIQWGWWGLGEGTFDPNFTYSIEFAGTDQDKDGLIEYAELSKLLINNQWSRLGCGTTDDDCRASFAFGTGNVLSFTYDAIRGPEFEPFFSEDWIHLGTEIGSRFTFTGSIQYDKRYRWTPETRLDVLTPVPEPGAWAMMGAGLAANVSGDRRWQSQTGQPSLTGYLKHTRGVRSGETTFANEIG